MASMLNGLCDQAGRALLCERPKWIISLSHRGYTRIIDLFASYYQGDPKIIVPDRRFKNRGLTEFSSGRRVFYSSRLPITHSTNNPTNMSEIADRIGNVRKEAEHLKDLIKQKRDALADTTRKFFLKLILRFLRHF